MAFRIDQDSELEDIKETLFNSAIKGKWEDVVDLYRRQPRAHKAKMVVSGETALHMAVSAGKDDVVEQLVELISEPKVEALSIGNDRGNTPLHLAASMGNAHMCRYISAIDTRLVAARNREKETPLFLAALHGHTDAFLWLREKCSSNEPYEYCRRGDGKTILHCAIAGEYFDLAILIIDLYEDLVNYVDDKGLTPLHVLASKPTAFRSGTHLHFIERLIYECIYVDKLKTVEDYPCIQQICAEKVELRRYPENYHTCMKFWNMIKRPVSHMIKRKNHGDVDADNPELPVSRKDSHHHSGDLHRAFPPNYGICLEFIKFANKAMLVVLGLGFGKIRRIVDKKEKHSRSLQIMDELLSCASSYGYNKNGRNPNLSQSGEDEETTPCNLVKEPTQENKPVSDSNRNEKEGSCSVNCPHVKNGINTRDTSPSGSSLEITNMKRGEKKRTVEFGNMETPILIAAKNGIKEMVDSILEKFPVAIHDRNKEKKNVVLLAVENRQPEVYEILLKKNILKDSVFGVVDNEGNSALHLAAMLGDYQPWHIPGAALQMQWEIKWYKFVKNSMPPHFFSHYNNKNQTPKEIFTDHHDELVRRGGKWLNNTSSSCSVIATLIATVAFATSATIPGSFNEGTGRPNFEHQLAFNLFAISSLVALCFSVTSMVMFLAILSSRHQEDDFHRDLPQKLLLGLTTLFISISAILVSFCAGHFFILRDELKRAAFPVYAITCLPISIFALVEFPLYFDVVWTTFRKVPRPRYKLNL
ncbi:hypothetical protein VitviT2T_005352 [Vitis vinifera]|uniref:PGG domain-containing protein n=1 Tax=Vitis vinifera TaxID=29760 RepID=A0ABY9BUA2_VITVI|nr:uncharacterized protein LOC100246246 [Vitis vinifera]WJZ85835.1 hypothetical protein VitviT2T_005352 [Vitis vinifera]|eukprot:XP_010649273.1 PREDICTED: uncharacterized protein LOC100246246 [Vitis vinifera]